MTTLPQTQPLSDLPIQGRRSCAGCGRVFVCGIANGDSACWCFTLPNIIELDAAGGGAGSATGCYCPDCLKREIARKMSVISL